jgi:acylphosphatase
MAEVLSVYGYVKNMYDGSVFIEVEGEEKNVNEFVEWCRKGPSRAVVENIEINGEAVSGFSDFKAIF